jgi:hypothetical protein
MKDHEKDDERPQRRGFIAYAIVALATRLVGSVIEHMIWR